MLGFALVGGEREEGIEEEGEVRKKS